VRPLRALAGGLGAALARPHLLAVLALVDLGIALVAVAPSYAALDRALSTRADAFQLASGLDFFAWLDVRAASPGALGTWPYALAAALLVSWVWSALSAAGWLSAARSEGFFAGIGRHGFRFLRLAAALALALVGLEIGRRALAAPIDAWAERSTSEVLAFVANRSVDVVHGVFVLLILAASDVAKARIASGDRRFVLGALASAAGFAIRRPMTAVGVGLAGAALQTALVFASGAATDGTLGPTQAGFFVPLLLGQVAIALRIAVRAGTLLAYSRMSEADLASRSAVRD